MSQRGWGCNIREPTIFSDTQYAPHAHRAAAQGWPGVILSDTLVLRQYSGYSDFSKSLAVNDAVIANAVPQTMPQGPLGVGINTGASPAVVVPPEGISPDIASIPNLVSVFS